LLPRFAFYSNYDTNAGSIIIDFVAPGSNIFSTFPRNAAGERQYIAMWGTSMSAAIVAGILHSGGDIATHPTYPTLSFNGVNYRVAYKGI
jgi:hypothetical protein